MDFLNFYKNKDYDVLSSYCIELNYKIRIACCVNICLTHDLYGNKLTNEIDLFPSLYFTCFTEENKSYIILSWQKKYDYYYLKFINQLKTFTTREQISFFNIILPILTEELFFSPKLFDNWDEQMKKEFFALCSPTSLKQYQNIGIVITAYAKEAHFNLFEKIE